MNHFVYTISKENIEMMDKEEKEIYFNILNKINKLNDKWNTKNLILNQYKLSLCIYIIIMLFVF
jgi:DNA replication initiation complex subunit (GINS family)